MRYWYYCNVSDISVSILADIHVEFCLFQLLELVVTQAGQQDSSSRLEKKHDHVEIYVPKEELLDCFNLLSGNKAHSFDALLDFEICLMPQLHVWSKGQIWCHYLTIWGHTTYTLGFKLDEQEQAA